MANPYRPADAAISEIAKMLSFPDTNETDEVSFRRLVSNTLAALNDINCRLTQLEVTLITDTAKKDQPDASVDASG